MLISRQNYYRKRWDIIPIICSIYNAILIPYEFSFGALITNVVLKEVIDSMIDILFVLDMYLSFFTTAQHKKGYEIIHPYALAKRYVATVRFKFDLLSLFGNNLF
jgi:hypothetical protein